MNTELKHFSSGLCSGCSDCQDSYDMSEKELETEISNGEIFDEGHFSWYACELCNSTLGGNRYAAHYRDDDNEICHIEICVDCLLAENE